MYKRMVCMHPEVWCGNCKDNTCSMEIGIVVWKGGIEMLYGHACPVPRYIYSGRVTLLVFML